MIYHFVTALSLVSAASAAVFTVSVGMDGLQYSPNNTLAQQGDVVSFQFTTSNTNHSVTQAAFASPCSPVPGGFSSGFVAVTSSTPGEEFNITITDASKPIWFYCMQSNPKVHCLNGMVGSVNAPNTGNTLDKFAIAAEALGSLPSQNPSVSLAGVGATASGPSPISDTSSTTASSSDAAAYTAPSSSGAAAYNPPSSSGASSAMSPSSSGASSASSPSASSSSKPNAASKGASMTSTSLWTLLAGILGVAIA